MVKFNMIGFGPGWNSSSWKPHKTCPIHAGHILVPIKENGEYIPGLQCPTCGSRYSETEVTATSEGLTPKFSGKQETRIVSAKNRNKKYYDSQGNQINTEDKDIMSDIAQGHTIVYYHEEKKGEETTIENKRIIRKRK